MTVHVDNGTKVKIMVFYNGASVMDWTTEWERLEMYQFCWLYHRKRTLFMFAAVGRDINIIQVGLP